MAATNLARPVVNGVPLITIEELAQACGLSIWRLRERVCDRDTRRGGLIPSYKVSTRRWFNRDEALASIYGELAPTTDELAPTGSTDPLDDDEDFV